MSARRFASAALGPSVTNRPAATLFDFTCAPLVERTPRPPLTAERAHPAFDFARGPLEERRAH